MIRKFGIATAMLFVASSLFARSQRAPFNAEFAVGTPTQSIHLRAVDANAAPAVGAGDGTMFAGAFRGVDVTRASSGSSWTERMTLTDPKGPRTYEYDVVALRGVVGAATDGRGVRFFGRNPQEPIVTLSAPEVIDREGKSSHRVWWELVANRSGAPTKLRLRIDDPLLVYPMSIRYSVDVTSRDKSEPTAQPHPNRMRTLATTGSISGTLRDAVTNETIPSELVHAYDTAGEWVASGVSGPAGVYTISDLAPGTYYVLAVPFAYDSELYNENPCPDRNCVITSGDPVSVTAGSTTSGINFTLNSLYARISGRVSDADTDASLSGVGVIAYDSVGNWAGSAFSNGGGTYVISLPSAGTYYARTANYTYSGYVDQVFDGINCTGCDPTTGTAITANAAQVTANVDFALDPDGGSISGKLTDADTGAPIAFEYVYVHNSAGAGVTYGQTDANGDYTTFNGLATGNYYVYSSPAGYNGEIYNNVACGDSCDPLTGTAVAVTLGSNKPNINISVNSNATRISGRVSDDQTSAGIEGIQVSIYDSSGTEVAAAVTDVNGNYTAGLEAGGTYYARTFASVIYPQYVDELYNNIPCLACNVTTGTQISVTTGATTSGINFALTSNGGSISGRVTDATTAAPITGVLVLFYDSNAQNVGYSFTDSNGDYTSTQALVAGTYYVVSSPNGYSGELYDNIPCPDANCDVTTGTGVVVSAAQNTPNINFALTSSVGRIRGTVLDESNNMPVVGVDVLLYDASGNFAGAASVSEATGEYEVLAPATGSYFVLTNSNTGQYANELYDNIPCSGCSVTTGTAVSATVGQITENINFLLTPLFCPFIDVAPATLPGGTIGDSYSQTLTATGGAPPYTFSVFESSLPGGLTLNATTGEISGTLSQPGSFTFTILATDDNDCVGGRTYTVEVTDAPPTITNVSPSSGTTTGGTVVTITGTNLSTVTSVMFDGAGAGIVSVTATSIQVDTPAHAAGTVDVTVTTSGGTATAQGAYTFTAPSTPVTLVSSLNPSNYGDSVTFTATLEDDAATGTITFYDDATAISGAVTVVSGAASFTTSSLSGGTHPITAHYSGDATYAPSVSNTVSQVVNRLTRNINLDVTPAGSSTYGQNVTLTATLTPADEATSVDFYDGATLLATVAVSGNTATYSTSSLNAGSYTFFAQTAQTAGYEQATSASVAYTVNKAARSISLAVVPSPSTYGDSVTLTATVAPTDEATTVEFFDGATSLGTATISGGSASIVVSNFNAGTHVLTASTPETTNYLGATSAPQSHLVNKASPVFSNLTSPTVVIGTPAVTVSGTITAGSLVPPGNVTITVAASTYTAAIDANGNFSASIATGALAQGTYPITFSYAGSANFNAATSSSTLTVTFGFTVFRDPPPANSPSTIPLRVKLVDANGNNLSSPTTVLTAYGIREATSSTWMPPNPPGTFQFLSSQGGQYKYNLQTAGLAPGNYYFGFTVSGDPVIHEIAFTVD